MPAAQLRNIAAGDTTVFYVNWRHVGAFAPALTRWYCPSLPPIWIFALGHASVCSLCVADVS